MSEDLTGEFEYLGIRGINPEHIEEMKSTQDSGFSEGIERSWQNWSYPALAQRCSAQTTSKSDGKRIIEKEACRP